jgi:two-component system response regulator DesR
MRTRVLIAEDVEVIRDTLVALLELEGDLEVVAELGSGDRIVPVALARHPDVALLDIDLPGLDGLSAAAELRERLPACRVLILTGLSTPDGRSRALAAGVSGFLVKDGPADELIDAVRRVAGQPR